MAEPMKALVEAVAEVLPPETQKVKQSPPSNTVKPKGLTKAILSAVEYFADFGGHVSAAAAKCGVNEDYLRRTLRRSDVLEYVKARSEQRLTYLRSKAVDRIDTLMSGARSEYVQLEAAKAALAETKPIERAGAGEITISISL